VQEAIAGTFVSTGDGHYALRTDGVRTGNGPIFGRIATQFGRTSAREKILTSFAVMGKATVQQFSVAKRSCDAETRRVPRVAMTAMTLRDARIGCAREGDTGDDETDLLVSRSLQCRDICSAMLAT
jgi:hypothetical protein